MAFGTQDDTDDVMNEINMTPLVDVMLVLLIIFMVTIPVLQHSVPLDLPRASSVVQATQDETLLVNIDAQGQYFINSAAADDAALLARLKTAAAQNPQPLIQIRGDRNVRYERVAQLMAAAQQAGLSKVAFITEPLRQP
ncbi:MAG: biopolymer transporter ExbD [Comamonadaceae bacterium]|jgi:biopolymer transport protein ExbD|nr:biopolymer transporter ExbD [Comamonadaceae bacterium]